MQVDHHTFHMEHVCYGRFGRNTLELHLDGVPVPVNVPPPLQQATIDRLMSTGIFAQVEGYLINRCRISLIAVSGNTARIFIAGDAKPLFVHLLIAKPLIDDIECHENPALPNSATSHEAFSDTDEVPEEPEMPPTQDLSEQPAVPAPEIPKAKVTRKKKAEA